MIKIVPDSLSDFEYFVKGNRPSLLLHAGTHGNEYRSVPLITECIKTYESKLPDFLYVPRVSPSAVKLKTRNNKNNLDLNRVFFNETNEIEVRVNINILQNFKFDMMISFHEDPETDRYYIYDEGFVFKRSQKIANHILDLKSRGVNLLNGVDDPSDPHLNFEFKDGYRQFKFGNDWKNNGTTTGWMLSEKRTKDTLTVEIPGKVSLGIKSEIIDSFFTHVIL